MINNTKQEWKVEKVREFQSHYLPVLTYQIVLSLTSGTKSKMVFWTTHNLASIIGQTIRITDVTFENAKLNEKDLRTNNIVQVWGKKIWILDYEIVEQEIKKSEREMIETIKEMNDISNTKTDELIDNPIKEIDWDDEL